MYKAVQGEAVQDLAYTQGSLLFGIRCPREMTFCNFRVIIEILGLTGVLPDYSLQGLMDKKCSMLLLLPFKVWNNRGKGERGCTTHKGGQGRVRGGEGED